MVAQTLDRFQSAIEVEDPGLRERAQRCRTEVALEGNLPVRAAGVIDRVHRFRQGTVRAPRSIPKATAGAADPAGKQAA